MTNKILFPAEKCMFEVLQGALFRLITDCGKKLLAWRDVVHLIDRYRFCDGRRSNILAAGWTLGSFVMFKAQERGLVL